ncbi:class A beta-lactamase [Spirilliplanes yamanashiensis]|uniref:Beta-lactamase n=1 Tax=Spirilliplanes yamanashiensis TaxID=42233 RepID=A0A8J3YB65_9ACTN|nr:class A beta-lactamase [Spirilliplanes yamanashiensis]MDP9817936.1 beta-lactamase class A [Spirilliplanes yamanashiensis]GIJ04745.1 beta-lactamase [Spirilliplanes yamanashiensis]
MTGTVTRRGLLLSALLLPACTPAAPPSAAAPPAAPGAPAASSAPPPPAPVALDLSALEGPYAGRIGAWALDTGTGRTAGHRADERFPLLSTFKALAAGAVLHRARTAEPGLLDRRLRWTEADLVTHSPVTGAHVADGLTVAELCAATVGVSDNTAGNLVLRLLGGPAGLTRYLRTIGDRTSRLDRWETDLNAWTTAERRDTTTPAAAGRSLAALTTGDALHPDDRGRLLGWLRAASTGAARIRAGLPATWTVGDKTGTAPGFAAANDIAVAHPPAGAPLVLAVYTHRRAPDATPDEAVIARTATLLAQALGRA